MTISNGKGYYDWAAGIAIAAAMCMAATATHGAESTKKVEFSSTQPKVPLTRAGATRTPVDLRRAVELALAAEAAATKPAERTASVQALVALAQEIAEHPTFAKSAASRLHSRIAERLKTAGREIEAQIAASKKPATIVAKQGRGAVLGQAAGPVFGPEEAPADGAQELADLIEQLIAPQTWEPAGGNGVIRVFGKARGDRPDLLAQVPAGPAGGNGNAPAARRFELTENTGPQLVELIQEVIAPQSWDVNGGEGTIVFLPGKNVLVVRATGDVHEGLADVVGQLRRN